jgi:hypothetical protein
LATVGGLPKWPTGADCKSADLRLRWFESSTYHHSKNTRQTAYFSNDYKGFVNVSGFGFVRWRRLVTFPDLTKKMLRKNTKPELQG